MTTHSDAFGCIVCELPVRTAYWPKNTRPYYRISTKMGLTICHSGACAEIYFGKKRIDNDPETLSNATGMFGVPEQNGHWYRAVRWHENDMGGVIRTILVEYYFPQDGAGK